MMTQTVTLSSSDLGEDKTYPQSDIFYFLYKYIFICAGIYHSS